MKISYQWLCELVNNLNQINPITLANQLTLAGLEVEGIIDQKKLYEGIVVGTVIEKNKHPHADKLNVCKVKSGKEIFQVVCGAANVSVNQNYPFATLGTTMPNGLRIEPVTLRQIESFGMLCSAKELQLASESQGLLELPNNLAAGTPLSQALKLDDVIFEIGITPNRGDALSHWGIAQDIAALTGLTVTKDNLGAFLPLTPNNTPSFAFEKNYTVELQSPACKRYVVSAIHGITVKPSPSWLSQRLENLGIRSINNVVDATNYIMLLTGQPSHAFAADKIIKNKIIITHLKNQSTTFTALDQQSYTLNNQDLIIADNEKTLALAGIIGGSDSAVETTTQNIILETAFFEPNNIRKTAKRLGIHTESSYRFERFVSPDKTLIAHQLLQQLILALATGSPSDIKDINQHVFEPTKIHFDTAEIKRILGIELPLATTRKILQNLDCQIVEDGETLIVTPPLARSDLIRTIDLVEEIARLHGLNHIPEELPQKLIKQAQESTSAKIEKDIKKFFIHHGFYETIHYSFSDPKLFSEVFSEQHSQNLLQLANPISEDLAVMRDSLLPQLLKTYQKNSLLEKRGQRLFELRHLYSHHQNNTTEHKCLAGIYGLNPQGRNRFGLQREPDFFDGKGILESLFECYNVVCTQQIYKHAPFHPTQSLAFIHNNKTLALVGALHPEILLKFKIKHKVYYFEIDFESFAKIIKPQDSRSLKPISQLPDVYRDLAIIAPQELSHQEVLKLLQKEKPDILQHIEIIDIYEGEHIPAGTKSLTYSFVYKPQNESLTDEEVNRLHFALVATLQEKLGVKLR